MSQSGLKPVFPVFAQCTCAVLEIADLTRAHGTFGYAREVHNSERFSTLPAEALRSS